MNFSIIVPDGTTNHGRPDLLCVPPKWYDYVVFFFANYFAHAATIVTMPGQNWSQAALTSILALFLPVSGITRATRLILRRPTLARHDALLRATRARAVCMVVRRRIEPHGAPRFRSWWECYDETSFIFPGANIHGELWFPSQSMYSLAYVPSRAVLEFRKKRLPRARDSDPLPPEDDPFRQPPTLAASYSFPKLFISLVQVIWAIGTLYQTRVDQLTRFGYAAFGLTVAQYAWMSIVNTFANMLSPSYPTLYLVRTPAMDEAEAEGCFFSGEIEVELDRKAELVENKWYEREYCTSMIGGLLLGLVPLVVVGALSGFRAGGSTLIQQVFTMAWLVVSILIGGIFAAVPAISNKKIYAVIAVGLVLYVPVVGGTAIVGMVLVGLMIREFGVCTLIG